PFAARWLETDRAEMALRRLKQANAIKGYPVLKEDDDALVSQAEHTLLVTEDGVEVTTAGIHGFDD
ncbi:type II methionyl aminopeptidase, partial [Halorubrum sp. E3]